MNENWRGGKETESFARRIREMETEKVCAGNNRKFLGRGFGSKENRKDFILEF